MNTINGVPRELLERVASILETHSCYSGDQEAYAAQDIRALLAEQPQAGAGQDEFGDAYQGAREDLAIWKRRALEAEEKLRNTEDGVTYMGEPVITSDVLVDRKAMEQLFMACGLSGTVSNTQIANLAANKLEARHDQGDTEMLDFANKFIVTLLDKNTLKTAVLADVGCLRDALSAALTQSPKGEEE